MNTSAQYMSTQTIIDELVERNPSALLFEPRSDLDRAIIGYTTGPACRRSVAIYDRDLLRAALADSFLNDPDPDVTDDEKKDYEENGVLEQDVDEWLSYNTEGAEMGENSPIVVQTYCPPETVHAEGDFF
jgi:hypothetical protein